MEEKKLSLVDRALRRYREDERMPNYNETVGLIREVERLRSVKSMLKSRVTVIERYAIKHLSWVVESHREFD